jgi:hypothetical protein
MVEVLADAAGEDDVPLAQTCRGILDGLVPVLAGTQRLPQPEPGDASMLFRGESGPSVPAPLHPPGWASSTVPEDDGITHELVSSRHPEVIDRGIWGCSQMPTDVSLSQRDLLIDGRWIRTRPRVLVEGGSYSLDGARDLYATLGELLTTADQDDVASEER